MRACGIRNSVIYSARNASVVLRRFFHDDAFVVHSEVNRALSHGDPVVALETTIVTHGMPHPHNINTALEVEGIIRDEGATPATIGVLDGKVHVGLTSSELHHLASASPVHKISRRDLAFGLSKGWNGGTTVAGTMMCAHKMGIPIFVTGGIGGVHRGGENSLDVSADLTELGRTPVGVVCAGIKSILDIGRTLEYLETQGVPVVAMGDEGVVPAFFSRRSGHKTPHVVKSPTEAAQLMDASISCGIDSGVVFTVPIPHEASHLGEGLEQIIQHALQEAQNEAIEGKEVTPFVLKKVNETSEGKSLLANIALIRNNARVGGRIAVELARLRRGRKRSVTTAKSRADSTGRKVGGISRDEVKVQRVGGVSKEPCEGDKKGGGVVVIGASILDVTTKLLLPDVQAGATNPGSMSMTCGGVARNIAECMSRLGVPPLFLSAVGKDRSGLLIRNELQECGAGVNGVCEHEGERTATYCVVLDHTGEFHLGVGDMDINNNISVDWVMKFSEELSRASHVCIDGNLPIDTMRYVLELCSSHNIPVLFEPTCVMKSTKPMGMLQDMPGAIRVATPNLQELRSMHQYYGGNATSSQPPAEMTLKEKLSECSILVKSVLTQIPLLLVSLGKHGVLYCSASDLPHLSLELPRPFIVESPLKRVHCLHYPASDTGNESLTGGVLSVSGAGDSFVGGLLAGINTGLTLDCSVKVGLLSASLSLQSMSAVSSQVNSSLLQQQTIQANFPCNPVTVQL